MTPPFNASIIGLGAMGSGMARSLLRCPSIGTVSGFDLNTSAVEAFYRDAEEVGKAHAVRFGNIAEHTRLEHFVDDSTDVVIIALLNESHRTTGVSSEKIRFVDAPISGGAARASSGELTIMASGHNETLDELQPIFQAMGTKIYRISGGVGMGSTVKVIHQILAGVHVVVAAEAIAMASKAGLDVHQFYDIVSGAAGNSWMFGDRGKRMMEQTKEVKSALDIMVKDLDIVCKEAKRLGMPVPLSALALQQFMGGVGMGLGREDDSSVVKIYEVLGGVSVSDSAAAAAAPSSSEEGDDVGDDWILPNGNKETILEVGDEKRHNIVISNDYTRVLKVKFPPKDTTLAHRHAEDSLYFFLVPDGLNVINHVKGSEPKCDCMEFGEVRYGTHKSDKPLVHKITNTSEVDMFCIDAEILKSPPVTNPLPLVAEHHTLIKTRDRCRVYKLSLKPGESATVSYPFFYLSVVLRGSKIKICLGKDPHRISWEKDMMIGDEEWCVPTLDVTIQNVGNEIFEQFIAEWR
ncbi:hypothetical protein HJC23_013417 [Cyclotella cryptica]|uniref:3-hydroxyisobutyrate dehydrogenase n=1 Tax=Cyclotella cryptica TaxID=29204 RepID=A0ABD3P5R9_9STRA